MASSTDSIRTLCKSSKIVIPTLEANGVRTLQEFLQCEDPILSLWFQGAHPFALHWAKIFRRRAKDKLQNDLGQNQFKEGSLQQSSMDMDMDMDMDVEKSTITVLVGDFGHKMWIRTSIAHTTEEELILFVGGWTGPFECFAMRDLASTRCGLAMIIPDNQFDLEQIERFIQESFALIHCTVWIREESYEQEDLRFFDEIPFDLVNCTFQNGGTTANLIHQLAGNVRVDQVRGIVGICCGPYVSSDGFWEKKPSLWIFSLFIGLVPVGFPTLPNVECVVIRAAASHLLCNSSGLHLEMSTVGQPLYSGLRLWLSRDPTKEFIACQSLGPSICLRDEQNKVVTKGYLTTMHGEKTAIMDTIVRDGDNFGYSCRIEKQQPHCFASMEAKCNFNYDERIAVISQGTNYIVGVDFCIATQEKATCSTVLHNNKIECIDEIVQMDAMKQHLGMVYKVGFKTGVTTADHISTVTMFQDKKKRNGEYTCEPTDYTNGLAVVFQKHLLLVHWPSSTERGIFMMPGDSGGLCYIENEDSKLHAIGICIGRIAAHFYLILPLSLIEEAYRKKGFTVDWVL